MTRFGIVTKERTPTGSGKGGKLRPVVFISVAWRPDRWGNKWHLNGRFSGVRCPPSEKDKLHRTTARTIEPHDGNDNGNRIKKNGLG